MRTIKKFLVVLVLVVLAVSIPTASLQTKGSIKTVTKLGSNVMPGAKC